MFLYRNTPVVVLLSVNRKNSAQIPLCLSTIRLRAMKKLVALTALILLALTGCSAESEPAEPATSAPVAIENYSGNEESKERVITYAEAIEASYQKLYETGMTERVTSAGDDYILSYAPQEEFFAGLYNVEVDDVIVVSDELFFTVASAYRALQDAATVVTETEAGISFSNPQLGDFTVLIADGLVVSGFDNNGSWTGEFSYEPDDRVSELVEAVLLEEAGN